jgi:hypothetical protein
MDKKIEKQLFHLWEKVGFIVNLSQMIEYNLSNILAFDEILREFETTNSMFVFEYNEFVERANNWYKRLSKMTFGANLKRAKEIKFFTKESEELLSKAIDKRNYVIHSLFKDDLKNKYLETNPKYYFKELEETISLLNTINESLVEIFKQQKEEHKLIW